jgi:hypothetical protein
MGQTGPALPLGLKWARTRVRSVNSIKHWEILKGLPGDGPVPLHFHGGHPTPWTEGFVVKFFAPDDSAWVGNFQMGIVGFNLIVEWPESKSVVVVANGACYLVPVADPASYSTHRYPSVQALLFDHDREMLFIADYGDVTAYRTDRKIAWRQEGLGLPGIALNSCADGVLAIEVEFEMGEAWASIKLAVSDGAILEAPPNFRRAPGLAAKTVTLIKGLFPGSQSKN